MKVLFKASFAEDLKNVKDKTLLSCVNKIIDKVADAIELRDVPGLKKLQGSAAHFRFRIGDYRLGIVAEDKEVTFVRFLHRKEMYRYFP